MILLILVALPAAFAIITFITRRLRLVSAVLAAGCLTAEVLVLAMVPQAETLIILGRPLTLVQSEAGIMAFSSILLSLTLLHSYWTPQGYRAPATVLGTFSLLLSAVIVRSPVFASMCFLLAMIVMCTLLASEYPRANMMAIRTLALLVLASLLLLLAAWAVENIAAAPAYAFLPYLASVALIISLGTGLGVVPFHIWQPPIYHLGGSLTPMLFGVTLAAVLILRLNSLLTISVWPGGPEVVRTLLQWGGLLSCVVASLLATFQSSVGRALAYAAIADMGVVLVGYGTGGMGNGMANLHFIYRGLAIASVSMGLGVMRKTLGGDTIAQLSGGFRRAPLSIMGIVIGGLSLSGVPLTASLTTRLSILQSVQSIPTGWTVALALASIGPAWAFLRVLAASLTSQPVPAEGKEPVVAGLIALLPCIALLVLGAWPALVELIPSSWIGALLAASPSARGLL